MLAINAFFSRSECLTHEVFGAVFIVVGGPNRKDISRTVGIAAAVSVTTSKSDVAGAASECRVLDRRVSGDFVGFD